MHKIILFFSLLSSTLVACESNYEGHIYDESDYDIQLYKIDWDAAADSAVNKLIEVYWNSEEKYFDFWKVSRGWNYWMQPQALDVLVDAYLRTQDIKYLEYMNDWAEGVGATNGTKENLGELSFRNFYYDDMEWVGLATLRAYDVTNDKKFLDIAKNVWNDIKGGWTDELGGGILWTKTTNASSKTKNACSNGPAALLACKMYNVTHNEEDKEWAIKIFAWLKKNLFYSYNGAVYDGKNVSTGNVSTVSLSYNQGPFLGASLSLYQITGEQQYLTDAMKAADFMVKNPNPNTGLIRDEGEDQNQMFKGIFIRNFVQLILSGELTADKEKYYVDFLNKNAQTLWRYGINKEEVLFGGEWSTPPTTGLCLAGQLSGCMLIEAKALYENEINK